MKTRECETVGEITYQSAFKRIIIIIIIKICCIKVLHFKLLFKCIQVCESYVCIGTYTLSLWRAFCATFIKSYWTVNVLWRNMYIWDPIWQSSNHALVSTMTNVAYCWRDVLLTSYKRCDVVNHMSHIWRTCVCGRRCSRNQSEIEWPRALWHCCSPSRLFAVSMSQSLSR